MARRMGETPTVSEYADIYRSFHSGTRPPNALREFGGGITRRKLMSYTTTIPAGKIDEIELIALIEQIKAVTKVDIKIKTQFVLTTENTEITE